MFERLVGLLTVSLRKLGGKRGDEVAFGRFLRNPKVTCEEILSSSSAPLKEAAKGLQVLAIQDTSEINYQAHAQKTSGLGTVGNGKDVGFFLHPILAVDAQSEAVLGLCGAEILQRYKSKSPDYKKLPIEEKESYRWLKGAQTAKQALQSASCVTIIADRESDIYEEWVRIPDAKTHLLTRACRNRTLVGSELGLFEFAEALPKVTEYTLCLPAREGRAAREARMAVRFSALVIKRPQACSDPNAPDSLKLYIVDVKEVDPPSLSEAVHWCLLTTHEVTRVEKALTMVHWYCQRWHIEQVFRTLKRQGLNVESSQIETAASLEKLVILALLAAVRTLQLVQARDGKVDRPATDVFKESEIACLRVLQKQLEGKTQAQKNRFTLGSLAWSAWLIARLGGWKGYASERPPGPITMLRGLQDFDKLYQGWRLAKDVCIP